VPFRIEVSGGSAYEIRHPELVMVGLGSLAIGIPAGGQAQPVYERIETVSLRQVIKLIPTKATGDGQSGG
jgi:hypothetical protein